VSVLLATVHVEQLEDVLLLVLDAHRDEDQVLPRVRGNHLHTSIVTYDATKFGSGSTCFLASRIRIRIHYSEEWIRIWLWIWIRILLSSCKNNKKNLESHYSVTLFEK
jgi:hypothetical protein